MSSASVTSSKREKVTTELTQEIESVRAMNNSLRAYLEHLRIFKQNLAAMYENYTQMNKVNKQWVETLSSLK